MRVLLAGLLLLAGAAAAEPPAATPAAEGTELIEALEAVPLAVVGTLEGCRALDGTGWRASVAVESVLVGRVDAPGRVEIAWEELATSRPARFANGDRVLLALEPITAGSLWRQRFPDPKELAAVRAVAQRGAAFLRRPSLGSLSLLEHYLALPADLRATAAGQRHLLSLAADGERALAVSAAHRLAAGSGEVSLDADVAAVALRALARADSDDELASWLLIWVERRQPAGLAPALDAALATPAGVKATFVQARGVLGEGAPAERESALLASRSTRVRAAAAGAASPAQAGRLADLMHHDPAPEVRVAALRRLARLEGAASLDTLLDAFGDADATVRTQAALQAAAFGKDVVPRLQQTAEDWPWPASETAVVALRNVNSDEANAALTKLADGHPDERIRTLAALALGRGIGHKD